MVFDEASSLLLGHMVLVPLAEVEKRWTYDCLVASREDDTIELS